MSGKQYPELKLAPDTVARLEHLLGIDKLDFREMALAAGLDLATSFRGKDLRGIDFGESDLSGFDFSGADLRECDFTRAVTSGTKFDGAVLDGARGVIAPPIRHKYKVLILSAIKDDEKLFELSDFLVRNGVEFIRIDPPNVIYLDRSGPRFQAAISLISPDFSFPAGARNVLRALTKEVIGVWLPGARDGDFPTDLAEVTDVMVGWRFEDILDAIRHSEHPVRIGGPKLFVYVVARDFGFAPNPFHGSCTVATCKPRIRATANVGDWIIGMGSATKGLSGRMIFSMRVDEALTFEEYWEDPRFISKRPYLSGSRKQAYGDNIYHRNANGTWVQEDSHHSFQGGELNADNFVRDTSVNRVLISREFYYFGNTSPRTPFPELNWQHPGHRSDFPGQMVQKFLEYIRDAFIPGCHGLPSDW